MEQKIQFSFIIVNYQSRSYLESCIASVRNNTPSISSEIIVVNNEKIPLILPPDLFDVKIIEAGNNIGFGPANNSGARKARGKYLCFFNADTELISNNIQTILAEFEKGPMVGIIGPRILSESGETQWWSAGKEITLFDLIMNNIGFIRSRKIWESQEKINADWISGAALFVRQDLFQKLKGFDEKFFMYYEDVDLCRRARKEGYKVLYFPKVKIKHYGGKSFSDKKTQKKYFYASQDYYFLKHFGKIKSVVIKFLRKIFHF